MALFSPDCPILAPERGRCLRIVFTGAGQAEPRFQGRGGARAGRCGRRARRLEPGRVGPPAPARATCDNPGNRIRASARRRQGPEPAAAGVMRPHRPRVSGPAPGPSLIVSITIFLPPFSPPENAWPAWGKLAVWASQLACGPRAHVGPPHGPFPRFDGARRRGSNSGAAGQPWARFRRKSGYFQRVMSVTRQKAATGLGCRGEAFTRRQGVSTNARSPGAFSHGKCHRLPIQTG
jgi:hypothetical protein